MHLVYQNAPPPKINYQSFDAGEAFGLLEVDDTCRGIPRDRKYRVIAKNDIKTEDPAAIWLVDQCWTWRDRREALGQLRTHEGLANRIASLMHLDSVDEMEILGV